MDNSYCEKKFLNDFVEFYESNGDYDITIVFDEFYQIFISSNTPEFLKSVHQYYNIVDETKDLNETLYSLVENMMCDKCESEANTDIDE